ncbi:anti-sigma factor [Pelomonas sp. KK5]|uniref:anti-sigma factor family protein n=1 Tax=Pelomonas sp. KK5 TaxID=1855730 RepID=UPI00117FFFFE|nr:anti-sigma factor [Pelomonas sp. KK5]
MDKMDDDDETQRMEVSRYADGEMEAAERQAFEARLAAEPALQRRLARERQLRAMLGASYGAIAEEPAPQRLLDALKAPGATVIPLAAARRPRWTWQHWGGMAASIALGLVIGRQMLPPSSSGDALSARGELALALDGQLSGQRLGAVTPGLSFVARGGSYCRTFTSADTAGLACRDGGGWRLRQLMPAAGGASGEYRTAASSLPAALLEAVDQLREGEVLDAQAEAEARRRRWENASAGSR